MKRLSPILLAAAAAAFACSKDSTAPDPDVIDGQEFAAVRTALDTALQNDPNYQTLRQSVFQFINRATHMTDASGEIRIAGIQLDIDAMQADTPVVAQLSGVLAWRGYNATTRTVDSVVFVIGTGLTPPVDDSLRPSFSPDSVGQATGFIVHQATDSTITAWQAATGALQVTSASYGGGSTVSGGGLTLTVYRGTLGGNYHIGATQVGNPSNTNNSAASFATGVRSIKIRITGTIP